MCCNELIQLLGADKLKHCFDTSNVAKEKGKEFRINTQKNLCRIKNDGCFNNSLEENKCDYIFKVCETNAVLLVELKGSDIDKAVTQIVATHKKILPHLKAKDHTYTGYIISSSVPNAAEQKFRRLKEKCRRDLNLDIDKKHFRFEVKI